ncbi:MAG TPA: hypothetical protein VIZ61_01925 [Solirubrobacterales bacterium]
MDAKRDAALAAIARAIANVQRKQDEILERLDGAESTNTLLGPQELARRLGRSRTWVYDHASELGAIRVGNGRKPRLLFDPDLVRERLARQPGPAESEAKQRPTDRNGAPLLPIRKRK